MPKTAHKKTIAVDIDEVLFPMAPTFLQYYNTRHGSDYKVDQMTSYYLENLTGESKEVMLSKIQEYLKTEEYSLGEPVSGSIEAIKKLKERFNLILVTARDHFFRGPTEAYLEKNFRGLYDKLYYTHNAAAPEVTTPKHVICNEVGAFALVDDHLTHVLSCVEHGVEGVLFGNYPWNQSDTLPSGVTRVKSWQEVLEYFNDKG